MNDPILATPLGRLHHADCLDVLGATPDSAFDLVFADPPFNLGKDYSAKVDDRLRDADYLAWCSKWIAECVRCLAPGGSFFLFNLPRWNVELGHILGTHGMAFRHWIAIDITYSLPIHGRLYPAHYSLLYYAKGKPKSFVRPRVPIAICRHCGGDVKDYGGHRDKLHPDGLNLSDVWHDIPPVRHRSTKRRGANELSMKLLRRVLEIGSHEGDLVFDPFGGSGTTYAACEEMKRRWVGCELGDVEPIIRRLRGEDAEVEPKRGGDAGKGIGAARRGGPRKVAPKVPSDASPSAGGQASLFDV